MKIFVTGGIGFIGSNIVQHHLQKGDEVFVLDNLKSSTLKNIESFKSNPNFKYIIADLLMWPDLDAFISWPDRIYHLAAVVGMFNIISDPITMLRTNISGTERLLQAMVVNQSSAKLILASSSSVYGFSDKLLLNEADKLAIPSPKDPFTTYATTKLCNEIYAKSYYQHYGLPIIIARPFNTIGPRQVGQYGMVVPRFVERACHNQPLVVFGDGMQTRSFCDVRDTVVALDLLAENPKSFGEIINIGNDYEITIKDLALLVKSIARSSSEIQFISYESAYGISWNDVTQRRPDLTKMMSLTKGFLPRWNLEKSLTDLVRSHNFLSSPSLEEALIQ